MRLWPPLLYVLLLAGCRPTEPSEAVDDSGIEGDTCTGEGILSDETAGRVEWTTEVVNALEQPVLFQQWENQERSRLMQRSAYDYDVSGFLVRQADAIGDDDLDDAVYTWQRGDEGEVLLYEGGLVDERGELQGFVRVDYNYEDGFLVSTETDTGADGTVDGIGGYLYEDTRLVRLEESGPDGTVLRVTAWTYLAAPPSLDHVEEQDGNADGTTDAMYQRGFDDQGRLVREEFTWRDVHSVSTSVWDEDHVLIEVRETEDGEGLVQWMYNDRGLATERRSEWDEGPDGFVDQANLSTWMWSCP